MQNRQPKVWKKLAMDGGSEEKSTTINHQGTFSEFQGMPRAKNHELSYLTTGMSSNGRKCGKGILNGPPNFSLGLFSSKINSDPFQGLL